MVIRPTLSNTPLFLPVDNSALYAEEHKEQRMQNIALTLSVPCRRSFVAALEACPELDEGLHSMRTLFAAILRTNLHILANLSTLGAFSTRATLLNLPLPGAFLTSEWARFRLKNTQVDCPDLTNPLYCRNLQRSRVAICGCSPL